MVIKCDRINEKEVKNLCRTACLVWVNNFGCPRACAEKPRIDKGVKRDRESSGEVGFLHRRDKAATAFLETGGDDKRDFSDVAELSKKQRSEFLFNDNKERVAKIEAFLSGHLDDDEVTDTLLADAERHIHTLQKAQTERNRESKLRMTRTIKEPPKIAGSVVYFESGCDKYSDTHLRHLSVTKTAVMLANLHRRTSMLQESFLAQLLAGACEMANRHTCSELVVEKHCVSGPNRQFALRCCIGWVRR